MRPHEFASGVTGTRAAIGLGVVLATCGSRTMWPPAFLQHYYNYLDCMQLKFEVLQSV